MIAIVVYKQISQITYLRMSGQIGNNTAAIIPNRIKGICHDFDSTISNLNDANFEFYNELELYNSFGYLNLTTLSGLLKKKTSFFHVDESNLRVESLLTFYLFS